MFRTEHKPVTYLMKLNLGEQFMNSEMNNKEINCKI